MKKYLFIAIISGFVTSCTNDSSEVLLPQNKKMETADFSDMEKDTIIITNTTNTTTNPDPDPDTGGQGGSTPIKPPTP
jgi:hypothetical protein